MSIPFPPRRLAAILAAVLALAVPAAANAHCDGLDGPVVAAARQALASGKPDPALAWVSVANEPEVRAAFDATLAARKQGTAARDLADRYFFETLVRVHRAGEGAPYTGLKPAGRDLGPAIPAADRALTGDSPQAVARLLAHDVEEGLHRRYAAVKEQQAFDPMDVQAGRRYVAAYVDYVHYVERVHAATQTGPHGDAPGGEAHGAAAGGHED